MARRRRVYRHRLTIEDYVETGRDQWNNPIEDWVPFDEVRGEVDPLQGREFFSAQQSHAEQTHRISMRYIKGIKPTMRVVWGERVFEIKSPPLNPMEQNYEIQLMCKEVVR